jgi:hypothetical protein
MTDGSITYDSCWSDANHEAEQDGWEFIFLDRIDDGFPFLVSLLSFSLLTICLGEWELMGRAVCYLRF